MSWEDIVKEGFEDIDSFIKKMMEVATESMDSYTDFNKKTNKEYQSIEMYQLGKAISDMGTAIMNLKKMRDEQERLQWVGKIYF